MTTRGELLTDLDTWLARDDVEADADASTFLRIAQARVNRRCRVRAMETTTQLVASARTVALPADFIALKSLSLDATLGREMEYLTPERLREAPIWLNQNGSNDYDAGRQAYTIEGTNIVLAPEATATANVTMDIVYFATLTDIATGAASATNWILTNAYDVYLWAALTAVGIWNQDTELQIKYEGLFNQAVEELHKQEQRARMPYASGLIATGHPRKAV